tara:strand:+ start:277 stop:624 length:348 start_codon:yes stop_codon:yes gene_type:complete
MKSRGLSIAAARLIPDEAAQNLLKTMRHAQKTFIGFIWKEALMLVINAAFAVYFGMKTDSVFYSILATFHLALALFMAWQFYLSVRLIWFNTVSIRNLRYALEERGALNEPTAQG